MTGEQRARRWWPFGDAAREAAREKDRRDPSYCQCEDPLLDADVGAVGDGDDEDGFCWACRKPIAAD
jgi:hypothetical protein